MSETEQKEILTSSPVNDTGLKRNTVAIVNKETKQVTPGKKRGRPPGSKSKSKNETIVDANNPEESMKLALMGAIEGFFNALAIGDDKWKISKQEKVALRDSANAYMVDAGKTITPKNLFIFTLMSIMLPRIDFVSIFKKIKQKEKR